MLRTERILWALMLGSVATLFGVAQMQSPNRLDEPALQIAFPLLACMQVALSFILPRLAMSLTKDEAARRRGQLIMSLAFCEAAALMGFVLYTLTAWPHSWAMFALSATAMILHFPRPPDA